MAGKSGSGEKDEKTHVVVSRYEPPSGKAPVVHVWGPYTLNQAAVTRRKMLREAKAEGYASRIEVNSLRVGGDYFKPAEDPGDPKTWPTPLTSL